jgi:glycerol-3-phosphate acyltransferase PlsY
VTAAAAAPAAVALLGYPTPMLLAASFMTGVIVIRHRPNLRRILLGTEPVLRKRQAPPCQ